MLAAARAVGAQCIRDIILDNIQKTQFKFNFMAFECPGSLGIGGKVWDSTYVLLKYLNDRPDLIRNKHVIELGSGTGLAGTYECM